jgi:hypothetical protein
MSTKHQLNASHAKYLLDCLKNGTMINEYYKSFFEKISQREPCVLDIVKRNPDLTDDKVSDDLKRKLIDRITIDLLEKSPKQGITKISKIHEFDEIEIQKMSSDQFSSWNEFVVVGCPDSTDIDAICYVDKKYCTDGNIKPLLRSEEHRLSEELKKLGYSVDRPVDINLIYVDPDQQTIVASSKGGTETQNIINMTWQYHKQILDDMKMPRAMVKYPVKMIQFNQEEIFNKLRSFAKYMLDYAEDICSNYQRFRPIKIELYSRGGDQMMRFMRDSVQYIECDPTKITNPKKKKYWHDCFKAMIMKLIQIIMLFRQNKIVYTKKELARTVVELFDNVDSSMMEHYEQGAVWYLYRGTVGSYCPELFPHLIKCYSDIVDNFLTTLQAKTIKMEYQQQTLIDLLKDNPTVDHLMLDCFLQSPEHPTEQFELMWNKNNTASGSDGKINQKFIIRSSDQKDFYKCYADLDPEVIDVFKKCFIFMDQRSVEWLDCLENKFVCGKCSAVIGDQFQAKYNLIRGSLLELFAMNLFQPDDVGLKGFRKWNLGFIVEDNIKGASGFAPDLVLLSNNHETSEQPECILVEIKGLKTSRRNADYYRGLHLANRQIKSGQNILGKYLTQKQLIVKRGVIILCYIENKKLVLESQIVDF